MTNHRKLRENGLRFQIWSSVVVYSCYYVWRGYEVAIATSGPMTGRYPLLLYFARLLAFAFACSNWLKALSNPHIQRLLLQFHGPAIIFCQSLTLDQDFHQYFATQKEALVVGLFIPPRDYSSFGRAIMARMEPRNCPGYGTCSYSHVVHSRGQNTYQFRCSIFKYVSVLQGRAYSFPGLVLLASLAGYFLSAPAEEYGGRANQDLAENKHTSGAIIIYQDKSFSLPESLPPSLFRITALWGAIQTRPSSLSMTLWKNTTFGCSN